MTGWFRKTDKTAPPVLDRAYLGRLARHVGEVEVRELVADGMLELADRIDRLVEHAGRDETAAIAEISHDIAGAAGHLGLTELSLAAVDAFRKTRAVPLQPGAEQIAGIVSARPAAMAALAAFCAGTTGEEQPTEP